MSTLHTRSKKPIKNLLYVLLTFFLLLIINSPVYAVPPVWESNFGSVIASLTGQDDDQDSVTLSFPFPFAGSNSTTVWVGTNGCLQLNTLGTDNDIDYDHWDYFEEFINDADPEICAFNADLDLGTTGTIHFNDLGTKAVFTWNEVGTNENLTALNSFQIQLFPDGTIIFGYNGILDGPGEGLLTDLDGGIVVGVTVSDNVDPGPIDLSTFSSTSVPTAYERWCYNSADSCGVGGSNTGLSGPINTAFDLDQRNVTFTPNGNRGFDVSVSASAAVPTMTEWGMIVFMLLAGMGSAYYLRKRKI